LLHDFMCFKSYHFSPTLPHKLYYSSRRFDFYILITRSSNRECLKHCWWGEDGKRRRGWELRKGKKDGVRGKKEVWVKEKEVVRWENMNGGLLGGCCFIYIFTYLITFDYCYYFIAITVAVCFLTQIETRLSHCLQWL
jgi:hypothetical protein